MKWDWNNASATGKATGRNGDVYEVDQELDPKYIMSFVLKVNGVPTLRMPDPTSLREHAEKMDNRK